VLIARFYLGERLLRVQWLGVAASVLGVLLDGSVVRIKPAGFLVSNQGVRSAAQVVIQQVAEFIMNGCILRVESFRFVQLR